jgi:dihydroorotate dehydrogenase
MYAQFIRPLLFLFDPEKIHHVVFTLLQWSVRIPGVPAILRRQFTFTHPSLQRRILGLTFANPVGLAAGFDKNAVAIDALSCFGFGFIEVGTLTPKPQPGNDTPRMFRLPKDRAIINRMGFNNDGAAAAVPRLQRRPSGIIVGGNIGKNKSTPNDLAVEDYRIAFDTLFPYVDYFVINVSSPNTPGLRALQEKEPLKQLLSTIKALSMARPAPKPVLLKIAPDLTEEQLNDVVDILLETKTDGVIATNTTLSREGLHTDAHRISVIGAGGLSGGPLQERACTVIRFLRNRLGKDYPIIGVGGIMSADDALQHLAAGADLVQVYTGFVYEGPRLASRICRRLVTQSA